MNKDYSGRGHEITAIWGVALFYLVCDNSRTYGCTEKVQRNTMKLLMYLINLPTNLSNKH